MSEDRRVYCSFCEQTYLTSDLEKCSLCRKAGGLVDPSSPAALGQLVASKRQQSSPAEQFQEVLATGVEIALLLRQLVLLVGLGVLLIGFGAVLIFVPDLRSNPRRLSYEELLLGFGVAAGGGVLLVWAAVVWRCAKANAAARARARDAQSPADQVTTSLPALRSSQDNP